VGHNKQISEELRVTFRTIFKNLLINLFFYLPMGSTSYVPWIWL